MINGRRQRRLAGDAYQNPRSLVLIVDLSFATAGAVVTRGEFVMGHGLGFGRGVIGLTVSAVSGGWTPGFGLAGLGIVRQRRRDKHLPARFGGRAKDHLAQPGDRPV